MPPPHTAQNVPKQQGVARQANPIAWSIFLHTGGGKKKIETFSDFSGHFHWNPIQQS